MRHSWPTGVWNTFSFGPPLLDGGRSSRESTMSKSTPTSATTPSRAASPVPGWAMIGPNHFLFVVADGRSTGYSRGVTMTEFAEIFQSLGANVAYNLDGGGSSTMVQDGELVNDPLGRGEERGTSDILYIA